MAFDKKGTLVLNGVSYSGSGSSGSGSSIPWTFIKEIDLSGNAAVSIPEFNDYDEFYIHSDTDFDILNQYFIKDVTQRINVGAYSSSTYYCLVLGTIDWTNKTIKKDAYAHAGWSTSCKFKLYGRKLISSGGGESVDLGYYEQNGFLSRNLLKAELESTSQFGVTLTKNGNEYTVNGTATGGTAIFTIGRVHLEQGKRYKIVGSKGSTADAFAYVVANGAWKRDYSTTANPFVSEITEDVEYIIRVVSGKTANNLTFRPMISENTDDNYDTYMPYAPSNTELADMIGNVNSLLEEV